MASHIDAVVFDIGGVLLDWNPRYLYERLIPDRAELDRFLTEICTTEFNLTLDAGRDFDDACTDLAARHPGHAELIHAWKRQDEMVAGEIEGTAAIVDELRDAGTPLYLLTNMPASVFRDRVAAYAVLRRFDGAVVSGEEGVLKPSGEIFAILCRRFALDAATTLFIDDSIVNVEGARASGLQAVHFTGAASLRRALSHHGLLS